MRKYDDLPEMSRATQSVLPRELAAAAPQSLHPDAMRCGGCGAKLGADALADALVGLQTVSREDVLVGLDEPDDAALVAVPANRVSALSVDGFRPMIEDPYVFGEIVANHCLGDLFAMGAEAQAALAFVTLPVMPERKAIEELRQMLSGALNVFNPLGVALVGGHTSEGEETSLAFTVTGLVEPGRELRKTQPGAGDVLVLTKALGTGTILAADMRARARAAFVDAATASMLLSNHGAARMLGEHGAKAVTDVTGFGLVGHLLEMVAGQAVRAEIALDAIPVISGALESIAAGWLSTLHPKNAVARERLDYDAALGDDPAFQLLFDPQTAGGLLAGVPGERAEACLAALRKNGFPDASIIGRFRANAPGRRAVGVSKRF